MGGLLSDIFFCIQVDAIDAGPITGGFWRGL